MTDKELEIDLGNFLLEFVNGKVSMIAVIEYVKKIKHNTVMAFGGCEKCYGKGYATYRHGITESTDFPESKPIERIERGIKTNMVFCVCDRGKQLQELLKNDS